MKANFSPLALQLKLSKLFALEMVHGLGPSVFWIKSFLQMSVLLEKAEAHSRWGGGCQRFTTTR